MELSHKKPLIVACLALSIPILWAVVVVATQDFQIFPGVWKYKIFHSEDLSAPPPAGYEARMLETRDRQSIELWKYNPKSTANVVSLLFHGNCCSVRSFTQMQSWLGDLGTNALQIDYRGYGKSSGWPSETGIFIDAETLWEHAVKHEHAAPERTIVMGYSLGTGPATYLASRIKPALLILVAPFTSVADVAKQSPFLRILTPFVHHPFENEEYLKQLTGTQVIIVHGARDSVVSVSHSRELAQNLKDYRFARYIEEPTADHNTVFEQTKEMLQNEYALKQVLANNTLPSIK